MAEQAGVFVKNLYTDDINVIRKLGNGTIDMNVIITSENEEMIFLSGLDVSLIINAPSEGDIKYGYLKVRTDIDLAVSCSRTDSNWEISIKPNDLPPEVPTMVYLTIGEDSP